jgi:hypothetical protein
MVAGLGLIWRAWEAGARSCTLCGSGDVRRSRHRAPFLPRVIGLTQCRCQACWNLFLLPSRLMDTRAAPGPGRAEQTPHDVHEDFDASA